MLLGLCFVLWILVAEGSLKLQYLVLLSIHDLYLAEADA